MTTLTTTTRRADVARNEEHILDAAARVLAERPEASMQEIADAAELNRVTLYRHFDGREALLTAIQRRGLGEVRAIFARLPARGDILPALAEALAEGIALGARYRVVALAPRAADDLLADEAETAMTLLPAIARGRERGEIDPELSDLFVAGAFAHLALAAIALVERAGVEPAAATRDAQRAFRKAVAAP